MIEDEIMQELRRVREEYAAKFNYDLTAMYNDLKKREQEGGWKIVSFASEDSGEETGKQSLPARAA